MKKLIVLIALGFLALTRLSAQECTPHVVVLNGLSINMNYNDADGDGMAESAIAKVNVNDFIRYGSSVCEAYPLTYTSANQMISTVRCPKPPN